MTNTPQTSRILAQVRDLLETLENAGQPLDVIECFRIIRDDVEVALGDQVFRARDHGRTWQQIAAALEVTPQAAHKRYA